MGYDDEKMIHKDYISFIPKYISGVYFLFNNYKELIYIGESKDIRYRLNEHKKANGNYNSNKPFVFVRYNIINGRKERKQTEKDLIKFLNPILNRRHLLDFKRVLKFKLGEKCLTECLNLTKKEWENICQDLDEDDLTNKLVFLFRSINQNCKFDYLFCFKESMINYRNHLEEEEKNTTVSSPIPSQSPL